MKTDNELIAEFMGGKWETVWAGGVKTKAFHFPNWHITDWPHAIYEDTFMYHQSWDWLMPVIRKILELCWSGHIKNYPTRIRSIENKLILIEIETTYKAVVEFIKWYNSETQQVLQKP